MSIPQEQMVTPAGGDGQQPPVIERRAPRWMKLVLVASLAVNLVIAGVALGVVLRGGPADAPQRVAREGVLPLTQALSVEERRAIGQDIRRDLRTLRGSEAGRAEFDTILALLRAETFDTMSFEEQLQRQAARGLVRIRTSQAALIRHLTALSPQERQAYADRVEAILKKRRNKPQRY